MRESARQDDAVELGEICFAMPSEVWVGADVVESIDGILLTIRARKHHYGNFHGSNSMS